MTGKLLPLQLVYQGKTKACLPSVTFPGNWDVTFSPNHWCNEITMEHCIQNSIVSRYVEKDLNLMQRIELCAFLIILQHNVLTECCIY